MQEPAKPLSPGEVATYVFITEQKPWRRNLKEYARHNRRHATPAEDRLWQALRGSALGPRFRR